MQTASVLVVLSHERDADDIVSGLLRQGYSVSAADMGGLLVEHSSVSAILGMDVSKSSDEVEHPEEVDEFEDDPDLANEEYEYEFSDELVSAVKLAAYRKGIVVYGIVVRSDEGGTKWSVCKPKNRVLSAFERLGVD